MKTAKILNVKIDAVTTDETIEKIDYFLSQKKSNLICTVNSEFIIRANQDDRFMKILNSKSSLNTADGFGLIWAANFLIKEIKSKNQFGKKCEIILKWLGSLILIPFSPQSFKNPLPERVAGSDLVWKISEHAEKNKIKIYLLGGSPNIVEKTSLELQTKFNDLIISGINSGGKIDANGVSENDQALVDSINKSNADILLVAFGSPKQEYWIEQNIKKLNTKVNIGIGGTFDFIVGTRKRAPKWMRNSGLEWLFRLIQEPKRFKRQLAVPQLAWLVLLDKLSK